MHRFIFKCFAVFTAIMLPSLALAHSGHENTLISTGVLMGMLHPLLGLDHLLSLIAVGVLSARLNGKQKCLVPLCFVALMLLGFTFAHAGMHLVPMGAVEMLITASLVMAAILIVAGKCLFQSSRFNIVAAWGLTLFASMHGMAHGLEIPVEASAFGFAVGFSVLCLMVMACVQKVVQALTKVVVQPQRNLSI